VKVSCSHEVIIKQLLVILIDTRHVEWRSFLQYPRSCMKKPLFYFALCVMLSSPSLSSAYEQGWQRHSSGNPVQNHGYDQGYHGGYGHHGHHHDQRRWGWSPLVSAAVVGSTLYWANQAYNQPSVTVIAPLPPPVVLEAPRVAYFCQSSRQYYPNVATCNMPWQLVPY
jgi:hypothetical protein